MNKIAFLYFDKSYIIYHSLSIAIELAKYNQYQIDILCTPRNAALVKTRISHISIGTINIIVLRPYWFFSIPYYLETKLQLKKSLFIKYKKQLAQYDAFVCATYNDLFLQKILGNRKKNWYVFSDHGIPNRLYSYDRKILQFDLFFLLGHQEERRRQQLGQLQKTNHAKTGFIKPDICTIPPTQQLFKQRQLTVLYNPHWQKELASFDKFGRKILHFFATHQEYNLIFAPHARLLARRWWNWKHVFAFRNYPNILIDAESERSNDMTYTQLADIYLGDASSQASEFIFIKERPCIFLDAHDIKNHPKERPDSWKYGEVIDQFDKFAPALATALEKHRTIYRAKQQQIKSDLFYRTTNESPSAIAAKAIHQLLVK